KSVFLPAFRVIARIITYDELQSTGVRVPNDGLAITTGPAREALNDTVSPPSQMQMKDTVICVCHDRDRGFVFLQDGLYKLGLCMTEALPMHHSPPMSEDDEMECELLLTTIGRAAVEMVWLGCLAITSFGP
ncbi:hypothetical protein BS17DRAFT_673493, partial [Gyrodon lividus]